jgi:hypothetical protein
MSTLNKTERRGADIQWACGQTGEQKRKLGFET